jgi:nucleotide-binding universal stress UspA family protein
MRWRGLQSLFWAGITLLLTITVADAEDAQAVRPSEFVLLVQIFLLIAVGRGLGEVMQRIGQPSVMGELLCGLLLGPSLFGWAWPEAQRAIFPSSPEQKALLEGIAQFGILLLLLLTGMETEARKGFDLLVIGMDKTLDGNGACDRKIETVCSGFRNPMAIAVAKGSHLKRPAGAGLRLLVPVSGSAVSRRGAEVAIALAQVSPDPLRVVYVSTTRDKGSRRGGASISLAREEAILKDTAAAAARYNVDVKTVLRTHTAPEQAILQEIRSSDANLVVLGVDRIAGEKLDFGSVAHAVLIESSASVLLVADGGPAPKSD